MNKTVITVTRQRMRDRFGGHWHYYAQGSDTIEMPDGRVLPWPRWALVKRETSR